MRYFTEEDAKSKPSTDIRIIYFDLLAQYVVYSTEREYLMLGKMSAQQLRQQRPSALKYARSVISEKASKATPISYIREFMGRLALELEQRLDTIKEIADRALELYKADVLTVRGADAMEACWFKYMEAFGEVFDKHSEAITSDQQNNSMMAEIMRSLKEVMAQNDEIKKQTADRRREKRPKLTQEETARIWDVSARTIRNWDKGEGAPDEYPGRNVTTVEMIQRAREYAMQERMAQAAARGMKNRERLFEDNAPGAGAE